MVTQRPALGFDLKRETEHWISWHYNTSQSYGRVRDYTWHMIWNWPLSHYRCSTKSLIKDKVKTHQWKGQNKISKWTIQSYTPKYREAPSFWILFFIIRLCMANGQAFVHKNDNFQIDGASRYFGVLLCQLGHLLNKILVCRSFQCCVLFLCLAKLYRSIHDKGLYWSL